MKKLMMVAVLILGVSGIASAQKGKGNSKAAITPEKRAELMTANMDKQLHLTPAQRSKVYALNLKQARSRSAARAKGIKRDWQAMKAARKADHEKLLSLLNNDQKKALKASRSKREPGRIPGAKNNGKTKTQKKPAR